MNENGYSWPEAILTLAIMMLIFSTLLPLSFKMLVGLEDKKLEMIAKETLYQGAILFKTYGSVSGLRIEAGTEYAWQVKVDTVCVTYHSSKQPEEICTN